MLDVKELTYQNIKISKLSTFDGYQINFHINNHLYQFLVGDKKTPFPLNVMHIFKEKDVCILCNKTIYPYPVGQQICLAFQKHLPSLLNHFQTMYPKDFIN
ncbi:hypothetical protein CEQ21_15000 [Niallia circulans]|uniref:Uncharacterized protein n=1 Tax=Niallia circulans TaxID=1397 RepID=A0A553SIK6_NIACI|nr:hypothetical protein [Niallia circulans]TRZ36816.1 hypothetical protein CEQ21_15000 [Niallia circulans]